MECPRCAGRVLRDAMDSRSCIQCGWEFVSERERAAGQWFVEWDAKRSPRARTAQPGWHMPSEWAR